MGEYIRSIRNIIKKKWSEWSITQRFTGLGIVFFVFLGLILLFFWCASPVETAILNVATSDQAALDHMAIRLDKEGIQYTVRNGKIYVEDAKTARYARAIFVQEDLVPSGVDPWSVFDLQRWTSSQFENDVRLRRVITKSLERHLVALKIIDNASVTLVTPKKEVLRSMQDPTTASVILTPKPGVDLLANKKQVKGIVRLIRYAVAGLKDEHITVLDNNGVVLNDFVSLKDFDRLELGAKILQYRKREEAELSRNISQSLSSIVGRERLEIINIAIELDYVDRKQRVKEYLPITLRKDNPETPYDETEVLATAPISQMSVKENFKGSAFNPEGPAGQEGQTPPVYKELENTPGHYVKDSSTNNFQYGEMEKEEVASPLEVKKIALGLAIDGTWEKVYDEKGNLQIVNGKIQRKYTAVPDAVMASIRKVVQNSVGINVLRGDTVTIENIPFDRMDEFRTEDAAYQLVDSRKRIFMYIVIVFAILIALFIFMRTFMKMRERNRRLREEELARQHQAMREEALRAAEEDIVNSQQNSLTSRINVELQEQIISMARDNPKGVADLLRVWLVEEL